MAAAVSFILLFLAAACNAVTDTLVHHHNTSIFKHHLIGFWSDAYLESWKNKYVAGDKAKGRKKLIGNINYPVQITDAWHLFKTLCIIFMVMAIVFYYPLCNTCIDIVLLGIIWNCSFSLFYNYVLIKKN